MMNDGIFEQLLKGYFPRTDFQLSLLLKKSILFLRLIFSQVTLSVFVDYLLPKQIVIDWKTLNFCLLILSSHLDRILKNWRCNLFTKINPKIRNVDSVLSVLTKIFRQYNEDNDTRSKESIFLLRI